MIVPYLNSLPFPKGQQKVYLDWIYSAKRDETKASRILKMMNKLQRNLRLHDEDNVMG